MTSLRPLAGACSALMLSGASPPPEPMAALDLCDYKPFFADDFTLMSISPRTIGPARWTAHTPWNGDFGDAAFSDPGPASPFSLAGGMLHITARKAPGAKWRSGLIAAADKTGAGYGVRFGYFEARMKLPPGPGTWPAFWLGSLKPASDTTPGIEVDVIEYYGHADDAYSSALHVWYKGDDKARSRHVVHKTAVPAGALVDAFHTYGARVAPDAITYYLDRQPVWQMPTPPELRAPLFPMVNLALGSGFPIDATPDPSVLDIDYVHVFVADPAGRASRCSRGQSVPNMPGLKPG